MPSSSTTSNVIVPGAISAKWRTSTQATTNLRAGAVPIVRYQTPPDAAGLRSSQCGAMKPFGSVQFGTLTLRSFVAALGPSTR